MPDTHLKSHDVDGMFIAGQSAEAVAISGKRSPMPDGMANNFLTVNKRHATVLDKPSVMIDVARLRVSLI